MRMRIATVVLLALGFGWAAGSIQLKAQAEERTPGAASRSPSASAEPRRSRCLKERDLAINPASGPLHVGLKTYPQTLKLQDHEVVLTFDDGPDGATTPQVLDALKEACVHATFFLIGRHTLKYPHLAQRELEEKHSVGHHSQTHPAFTLRGFDTASAERDIETGITADERAIYGGAATPEHPHIPFFRFPGFADTPELLDYLDKRKIAVFGADMWIADWLELSPARELQRSLAALESAPHHSGILLFHDTRPATADMLPELLAELRARHYTIVHLVANANAAAPSLTAPTKGWSSETERIIAHLRQPIVPGVHHATDSAEGLPSPGGGDDATPQDRPL